MSELERRLVHASGSAVPIAALLGLPWTVVRYVLLGGTALALSLEALRLSGRLDWAIYDRLTRDYERDGLAGYALYVIGFAVTAWLFDESVAVPAMLMLSVADPISGLLSSGDLGVKSTHVLLATFGVSLAIASLLAVPLLPALAGALAATVADGVKPTIGTWVIDDNLTIPVAAGAAMSLGLAALA
ncbi:MAG: dolichol kinase [Halanaeroarchaeum sp.]